MADKRNQEIRDFCEDFAKWLSTRKYYAQSLPLNILAQMQPRRNGVEPDAENSQLCAAFYLSLMLEISKDVKKATCFLYVFFPKARPKPIKTLAFELGINKDTANEWAHETALNMFRLAQMNCQLKLMMNDKEFKF